MSAWRRDPWAVEIGSRIGQLRESRRWTQLQLAMRIDISPEQVARWETGRYRPHLGMMCALSDLFGVGLDYLVRGRSCAS